MTNQQTYTSKSNAKRAARADLGKDAVEGRDYQITKGQGGRFSYRGEPVRQSWTQVRRAAPAFNPLPQRRGPCRAATGAINTDCG